MLRRSTENRIGASAMKKNIITELLRHKARGSEILFGRSHAGKSKIKVKYGPFGLFTKRYSLDHETFELAKRCMRQMQGA